VTTGSTYQAVTANRLADGVTVYFTVAGTWSTAIDDAAHAVDATDLLATAATRTLEAVGAYVIAVEKVDATVRPVGLREQIRAFGPTV
jgi:hypothetical protein